MYGGGLDRFKKAQSLKPFSVEPFSVSHTAPKRAAPIQQLQHSQNDSAEAASPAQPVTQIGGGQSMWQPPDWPIEPRPGVYYLEVMKDGEVLDWINL